MSLQQSCESLKLTEVTTMIKERIPISGDLKSKVRQLMEYAGWQEGRNVDISIAEKRGEVLRRAWRPYDEDHPAVLPQVFRPVL